MKTFKYLASAALALAFTASAYSQALTIRIVASNGDRTATQTAISKLLSTSAGGPLGTGWGFQGINGWVRKSGSTFTGSASTPGLSTATGANFGAWNGRIAVGNAAGVDVVIKVSYSGALAGIQAVAGLPTATARFVTVDGSGTTTPPNPLTSGTFETAAADFGFSTNFQSTSPYNGLFQGVNYNDLEEVTVGISPLGFYASPGFPGSPSSSNPSYVPNITTQLVQQLYTGGSISLAAITGDWDNDKNKIVYAIGRNVDAGQRFGAYLENGIGFNQSVNVWFPTFSTPQTVGSGPTAGLTYGGVVGSHVPWPVAQQPGGFPVGPGSGGYNSGANLAAVLTVTLGENAYKLYDAGIADFLNPDATAGYYIGYLTPGDANNRVLGLDGALPTANRGVALTYNGVALTEANVKNGTYTAWLYNRLLRPTALTSGNVFEFSNTLANQIATVDAVAGGGYLDDTSVKVLRTSDGGPVQGK